MSSPDTSPPRTLTGSELKRKVVHIAVGGFALLLRFLTWPQAAAMAAAAFLFNWQVLPRVGGRGLWREIEYSRGYPAGILLYPLSVLVLVLLFRHELWMVASIWGVLAVGDGTATLAGRYFGGPRLPWNPAKGWVGLLAFVAFSTAAASFLAAWTLRLPGGAWTSPRILALTVPLSIFCALVETIPTTLDDNFTVPLAGALFLPLLADAPLQALASAPWLPGRLAVGAAVNAAIAVLAWRARSIDVPGAFSAALIGTAITASLGLPGLAVMIAFFVIGTLATKAGYRVKAARGIAQEKGGARGWRNAWANGGVAAFLAILAGAHLALESHGASGGDGRGLLLTIAYAAAVATAAADTCSSEVGKAWGRRTFLITSLRPVAPGTEGAISLEGTLGGLAGGLLVAAVGAATGLYAWPAVAVVGSAGLLGSLAESVIGTVAERRGWLSNDLLNAVNTAIGAALAVALLHAAGWDGRASLAGAGGSA
jgi:uncharacterized protein (TIGR00297 family)